MPSVICADCLKLVEYRTSRPVRCADCRLEQNRGHARNYARRNALEVNVQRRAKRQADPEAARAYERQWREQNPDKQGAWAKANPERHRMNVQRWRDANTQQHRLICTKWKKENPASVLAMKHARRALEIAAEGTWSAKDLDVMRTLYKDLCPSCGSPDNLEIDHIVPLAWGGNNFAHNLALLCKSCNGQKGARWITEFEPWDGETARPVMCYYLGQAPPARTKLD